MSILSQAEKNVFGEHAIKDEFGRIVENGIGAIEKAAIQVRDGTEAMFDTGPLIDRLAELEAENAALKASAVSLHARIADDATLVAGLEDKNAELTKQVEDLTAPKPDPAADM